METDYSAIINQYPAVITMDQMYRICHISKRKAKWLLENGVIPCQDSGKKTRRFRINTIDVIYYLQRREHHPDEMRTPVGLFNSEYSTHGKIEKNPITPANVEEFKTHLEKRWHSFPDILYIDDIQQITGYHQVTIYRWLRCGKVKSIDIASKHVVAKEWLIAHIAEYSLTHRGYLSEKNKQLITEYISSQYGTVLSTGTEQPVR